MIRDTTLGIPSGVNRIAQLARLMRTAADRRLLGVELRLLTRFTRAAGPAQSHVHCASCRAGDPASAYRSACSPFAPRSLPQTAAPRFRGRSNFLGDLAGS